ncbi:MAG: preprotein translocase subunit YajC [Deltaproteobacteria bacterium]|nr:preprotein translocase subunit YajC [Deltaproteobacteria bacterium]
MGEHVSTLVAQSDGGAGFLGMALPLVVMVVVMYFLMIRPERKKASDHAGFLTSLKRGDEVVLTSGIIGKIHAVDDRTLTLEIADKVKIKVLKIAVTGNAGRFLAPAGEADKVPKKEESVAKVEAEKKA